MYACVYDYILTYIHIYTCIYVSVKMRYLIHASTPSFTYGCSSEQSIILSFKHTVGKSLQQVFR